MPSEHPLDIFVQMREHLSSRVSQTWSIYAMELFWLLVVAQHLTEDAFNPVVQFISPRKKTDTLLPLTSGLLHVHTGLLHRNQRCKQTVIHVD